MTDEQITNLRYLGFTVGEEDPRRGFPVESESIPDLTALELMLSVMTFKEDISYWNAFCRSPSDPGGYVTALRLDSDTMAYREGNHGWIGRWELISLSEAARRIQENWDKDCDYGLFLNRIYICRNKHITKSSIMENMKKQG